jgi:toxin secretion/phage lysis holin
MQAIWTTIKLAGAVIFGFLSYFLGGWDTLLRGLVVLTCLDIVSGISAGIIFQNVSSRVAWTGFTKKIGTYVIIALAVQLDILLGTSVLRQMTVGFFITVEGISILENWGRCGLPLPQKLRDVLEQLNF